MEALVNHAAGLRLTFNDHTGRWDLRDSIGLIVSDVRRPRNVVRFGTGLRKTEVIVVPLPEMRPESIVKAEIEKAALDAKESAEKEAAMKETGGHPEVAPV